MVYSTTKFITIAAVTISSCSVPVVRNGKEIHAGLRCEAESQLRDLRFGACGLGSRGLGFRMDLGFSL